MMQYACDMQSPKKQCGNARKTKDKSSPSEDPQSIAAKVFSFICPVSIGFSNMA